VSATANKKGVKFFQLNVFAMRCVLNIESRLIAVGGKR